MDPDCLRDRLTVLHFHQTDDVRDHAGVVCIRIRDEGRHPTRYTFRREKLSDLEQPVDIGCVDIDTHRSVDVDVYKTGEEREAGAVKTKTAGFTHAADIPDHLVVDSYRRIFRRAIDENDARVVKK